MASRRALIHFSVTAFLLGGVALAVASTYSEFGPLDSMTGAEAIGGKPAENNCTLCHYDDGRENLNRPGGGVELLGLPAAYSVGIDYPITVRLHSDSTVNVAGRKWGFQVTAVRASDGEGAGTFTLTGPDTLQVVSGSGIFASRRYVEHTSLGVREGLGGPVTWTFQWRAPASPSGTIHFYFAGNAGNANFEPSWDNIYTGSAVVLDATVPVQATSWGALKGLFRGGR